MTYLEIRDALSSEKLAVKLLQEIKHSRHVTLNTLLPAFSIPLIGKTAATKLSTKLKNLLDLDEDKCTAAGLGPKATENLLNWYNSKEYAELEKAPIQLGV